MNQTLQPSTLPAHLGAITGNNTRLGLLCPTKPGTPSGQRMLIMAESFASDLLVTLWADAGDITSLLALGLYSTREVTVTPRYNRSAQTFSTSELLQLFEFIFDHPEALPPKR